MVGGTVRMREEHFGGETGPATLLDAGLLPVEQLAVLGEREGWRPRPIYQVHRWFARRFGSAFRALLTAANTPIESDFWTAYYEGSDWSGRVVLDPFVGGGTSVVEAQRLGASVVGVDVDAVACAITRFELRAASVPNLANPLKELELQVGEQLSRFYRTMTMEGDQQEVLHYFWVQVVACRVCGQLVEAHPHYQLAYEAEGVKQWVFCPNCHHIHMLDRAEIEFCCKQCGDVTLIHSGPVRRGRLTCLYCSHQERLIEVAPRIGHPPTWRLFALETLEIPSSKRGVPIARRRFRSATEHDRMIFAQAETELETRHTPLGTIRWVPDRRVPHQGRADRRLIAYGYERYEQLFNARQLLHLSCLAEAIDSLQEPLRDAMALAFSDHLTTNCMMTQYAFGWRRLTPLFSIRAFRHVTRPVEINPWLNGIGRGTFPNTVRQVQRAVAFAQFPQEPLLKGGFRTTKSPSTSDSSRQTSQILQQNSEDLSEIESKTVDFVLTDPPYFDNIAYSELSDFFLPWLRLFGLARGQEVTIGLTPNLAAKGRRPGDVEQFQKGLAQCFREIARVLKPTGRLVFTYQHQTVEAWKALAQAVSGAGLKPIQLFPLLGDHRAGLHAHKGSIRWDAVFVAVNECTWRQPDELRLSTAAHRAARDHCNTWTSRLTNAANCEFRDPDQRNFQRACFVGGALGMFADDGHGEQDHGLDELLAETFARTPSRMRTKELTGAPIR